MYYPSIIEKIKRITRQKLHGTRLYRAPNTSAAQRLMRHLVTKYDTVSKFFLPRMIKKNMQTGDFVQAILQEAQKKGVSVQFLSRDKFCEKKVDQNLVKELKQFLRKKERSERKKIRRAERTLQAHHKKQARETRERQIRHYRGNLIILSMAGNEHLVDFVSDALDIQKETAM